MAYRAMTPSPPSSTPLNPGGPTEVLPGLVQGWAECLDDTVIAMDGRLYAMSAGLSPQAFPHPVGAHPPSAHSLHLVLDASMSEDRQRNRKGYGPQNLAPTRRMER